MFLYQKYHDQIEILGCLGYDGDVRIPDTIDRKPVTRLAPYAFSDSRGRGDMLSKTKMLCYCDEEGTVLIPREPLPPEVTGSRLLSIRFPEGLEKIGSYAFYNCYELSSVEFHSPVSDVGSGLFTGCYKIKNLEVHIITGKRSCLKEFLSELRQQLTVSYECPQGKARLLFPEMFEESVENTPARIITREMHGCGHRYRYCFDQTEFQFQKYDALFPHVIVQEPEAVTTALVLGRLFYPLGLTAAYKEAYESYLAKHMEAAAFAALEEQDEDLYIWLARQYARDRQTCDRLVELANSRGEAGLLGRLMELRRERFPSEKRSFIL